MMSVGIGLGFESDGSRDNVVIGVGGVWVKSLWLWAGVGIGIVGIVFIIIVVLFRLPALRTCLLLVVFFLFIIELFLQFLGKKGYWFG